MSSIIAYTDGDFSQPQPVSRPRLSQPFPGDDGEYVLQQDFMQDLANFAPLALNTAYPWAPYGNYVLVAEGPLQNVDGGSVRWTRTYALVPAMRSDGGSIAYQFIGFGGQFVSVSGTVTLNRPGRPRFTRTVSCRIQHDYYLIGSGGSYANIDAIPLLLEQMYFEPDGVIRIDSSTTPPTSTFTPYYQPTDPLYALTGMKVDYLLDAGTIQGTTYTVIQPTVPSRAQYLQWMQQGAEIIAEGSKLTRWMGNIFDRTTTYIIAQ